MNFPKIALAKLPHSDEEWTGSWEGASVRLSISVNQLAVVGGFRVFKVPRLCFWTIMVTTWLKNMAEQSFTVARK